MSARVIACALLLVDACGEHQARRESRSTVTLLPAPSGTGASPLLPPSEPPAVEGTMIHVPRGKFLMGSRDGDRNERPPHDVTVASFDMDATEVTVAAYDTCVKEGGCAEASSQAPCNEGNVDRAHHPINCVSWEQATAYCHWAGKRLPTEAEWEYAARGTDGRTHPWGNAAPDSSLLNACGPECVAVMKISGPVWQPPLYPGDDGFPTTAPVASFPKGMSPFGIFDMAGNVWEWTSSGYSDDYDTPPSSSRWVQRGGGWDALGDFKSTERLGFPPEHVRIDLGFRCAR